MLGQRWVTGREKSGAVRICITGAMPPGQTIQLVLKKDGVRSVQDEGLPAADDAGRGGLRRVETTEKKIAVAFDAAGGLGQLPALPDTRDELNIRCTFFLQGKSS